MFTHKHPYEPFIPVNTEKLIVGTLPPPRFSMGMLKEGDVNFCYGSIDGQLWKILDRIFDLNLDYENTKKAITQRKDFLIERKIGICDIVSSCKREKIDASDLGMQDIVLRNMCHYLEQHKSIHTLLLTGGNSKNGPEYHLRRQLKDNKIPLISLTNLAPRIHSFNLSDKRTIRVVSLTAPSGSANRAVGSNPQYKALKKENPKFNTLDYRVLQYKPYF
jgi:G:T/U-mismatch repair DNA glycosylase